MNGILIMDDDRETWEAVQSIKENSQFMDTPIWKEEMANKGIELIKEKRPAFLLMELSLPDMDGIEFGKKAKEIHPTLHVIVVTHLQMFKTVQSCMNAGFSAYLLKPIANGELLQTLDRLYTARLLHDSLPYLETKKEPDAGELETDLGNPIQTAIKFIHLNYHKPIHLKEAADLVYLSPSYFSRLFKEETGVTFVEFLTDYRLEKSKHLLKITVMPIETIANLTGFGSAAYFATSFKRKEGQTPKEYRNMCTFSKTDS
ncbi:helix-turn-helix domain-containing protein [Neobacillus sp. BF23-41]|uniref:helix-turn-helix domain-containing protein n=1 Tax=Neobacillus sp. BF23-41 TaxID=3240280 RepID=UPI0034E4977F